MYSYNIRLAGRVIGLKSEQGFPEYCDLFPDFRTDLPADVEVEIRIEEVASKIELLPSGNEDGLVKRIHFEPDSILFKVADALIDSEVLLLHGAAVALNGQAYLFSAPSATGKTTHVLKWTDRLPNAFIVNGDKPFVRFSGEDAFPMVCGSPWAGKENLYRNVMVPLKAIVLMERAEENRIRRIPFVRAFPELFREMYRPADAAKLNRNLNLLCRLSRAVSLWQFECNNFREDCFDTAYRALVREQALPRD